MNKNSKHNSYLKFRLKDEDVKRIQHDILDSKDQNKGIRIKIEATHSGIVNGNKKFYLPVGMKAGTDSFVKPYPKPVTVNHDQYSSPLGRITEASYISYNIGGQIDSLRPRGISDSKSMSKIREFIKSSTYQMDGYKGLGHIQLIAEINDKDAIQKIVDKRYLTVSIGGGTNAMYCSICGVDNKRKSCDHYPGQIYDGEECFFVSGDLMDFDHVSYVNSPADKNTNTELLDSDDYRITILDFITLDKGKKMNLKDFLQDKFPTYKEVRDYMEGIGLAAYLSDDTSNVKELDFVLLDEKILPIHDKAHAIAARLILQDAEIEDTDKNVALEVIDEKLTSLVGEAFSINDELEKLKTPATAPIADKADNAQVSISDEAINNIVAKVVDELKKSFNVSDSYSVTRLKSIQRVNDSLEAEVQSLTDKLRKNTINQILTLEDKLSDNDYRSKLEARNISSLEDKLDDLINGLSDKNKQDDGDNKDGKSLEPNSVDKTNVSDKVNEDDSKPKQEPDNTNTNKLSNSEIVDEYKRLIREKGLSAAKKYIQDLRDENKLPDNFTFNGV